jgi:hypothetical protein
MTLGPQEDFVVAGYDSRLAAEIAVEDLHEAGLDMKRLSIVGEDFGNDGYTVGFRASHGLLAAHLTTIGVANANATNCELAVRAGSFLVLVRGTADMAVHARAVLGTPGVSELTANHQAIWAAALWWRSGAVPTE